MKLLLPLLALALSTSQAASPAIIMSGPSKGVSRFDSTAWKQLHYDSADHTLIASVTFANTHYYSGIEPRHTARRDFFVPNVSYHAATGEYTLGNRSEEVLASAKGMFKTIEPAPNTRYHVLRNNDSARLEVEVFPHAVSGPHWLSTIEPDRGAD